MKRIIVSTICLVLMAAMLTTSVLAASSVSIDLNASSTTVGSGDTITVTVNASVDSCGSGGIEVAFDTGVFQLTEGQWKLSNAFMSDFSTGSRDGVFAFDGTKKVSGSVFQFKLKVKDGAALGKTNVSVSFKADSKTASKSVSITIACDHKYDNSCDTTCNRCGVERSISHSWNSGKVLKAATCTAAGSKEYTCKVCGKTKTEKTSKASHTYDNACDTTCNVCGGSRNITHAYKWVLEGEGHIQKCSVCGVTQAQGEHTLETTSSADAVGHGFKCSVCGLIPKSESHIYESDCDTVCDTCGYVRTVTHAFSDKWTYDSSTHWHACMICGEKTEAVPHIPGEPATETTDQICMDCGYVIQPAGNHAHTMAGDWQSNDVGHWFLCACLSYTEPENHTWDAGTPDEQTGTITYQCTVCGYNITEEMIVETVPTQTPAPTQPEKDDGFDLDTGKLVILGVLILLTGFALGFIVARIFRP